MEFRWTSQTFDLKTFVKRYGKNLPLIVRVTDGFCGIDEQDEYSYSNDDEYRITNLNKQSRIIAKDKIGRHISLPIEYPVKFQRILPDGDYGEPKLLTELVEILHPNDKFEAQNDGNIEFWIGTHKKMSVHLETLQFIAQYEERYLAGNLISEGTIYKETIDMPVYVPIRIAIAEGLENNNDNEFDDVKRHLADCSKNVNNEHKAGNSEIMLFEGKITDYKDYDYIKPSHYLRCGQVTTASQFTNAPTVIKQELPREAQVLPKAAQVKPYVASPPMMSPIEAQPKKGESGLQGDEINSTATPKTPPALAPKPQKHRMSQLTSSTKSDPPLAPPLLGRKKQSHSVRRVVPAPEDTSTGNETGKYQHHDRPNAIPRNKQQHMAESAKHDYENNIPRSSVRPQIRAHDEYEICEPRLNRRQPNSALPAAPVQLNIDVEDDDNLYELPEDMKGNSVSNTLPPTREIQRSFSESAVKSPPPAINTARKSSSVSESVIVNDIGQMSVEEVSEYLHKIKLSKFVEQFKDTDIDGSLLVSLVNEEGCFENEFGFSKFEALKLKKFVLEGWLPKRQ